MKTLITLYGIILLLSGCVTKHERDMNKDRQSTYKELNIEKTYHPVVMSGIQEIKGDNITITTTAEHNVIDAPDLQYDTSDTDLLKSLVNVGGAVTGAKILSDSQKVQTVEQPKPIIVRPEVIQP